MLAQGIMGKLLNSKGSNSKMQRVLEATEKGVSIIAAMRGEFGDDFLQSLTGSISDSNTHGWTYEAGCADYIKLNSESEGQQRLDTLREELNINLDRLTIMSKVPDEVLLNYFRGTISIWRKRYIDNIGINEDARKTFAGMDALLDGNKPKFKDVLEKITRICLGGTGLIMVIKGVLLAINTRSGWIQKIKTSAKGIPWDDVGILVIPGVILIALSLYKFSNKHAVSTCIKMAYDLLEKRHVKM